MTSDKTAQINAKMFKLNTKPMFKLLVCTVETAGMTSGVTLHLGFKAFTTICLTFSNPATIASEVPLSATSRLCHYCSAQ